MWDPQCTRLEHSEDIGIFEFETCVCEEKGLKVSFTYYLAFIACLPCIVPSLWSFSLSSSPGRCSLSLLFHLLQSPVQHRRRTGAHLWTRALQPGLLAGRHLLVFKSYSTMRPAKGIEKKKGSCWCGVLTQNF